MPAATAARKPALAPKAPAKPSAPKTSQNDTAAKRGQTDRYQNYQTNLEKKQSNNYQQQQKNDVDSDTPRRKSATEIGNEIAGVARQAAALRKELTSDDKRREAVNRQNEFTMQSRLQEDRIRAQEAMMARQQNGGYTPMTVDNAISRDTARQNAEQDARFNANRQLEMQRQLIRDSKPKSKGTTVAAYTSQTPVVEPIRVNNPSDDRFVALHQQKLQAENNAKLQKEVNQANLDGQSRLQSERATQAKEAATAAGEFQSRLQRERSEQGLQSQREGVEGQSRLQSERSSQSLTSQREAATSAMERAKFDVEGRSRLQREGADQGRQAQSERAEQGLRSQREGIEGQSRLQKERSEQSSKLQSQAAAESAARSAGNRAAAIAAFRNFGKGR
jgi:hypothetical protein